MGSTQVLILMGSDSDFEEMRGAIDALDELGVACEVAVASAHRTPEKVTRLVEGAAKKGVRAIIAGAGGAAHLAGVVASQTLLPVIGVPLAATPLGGLDALLSTVQMPPGIPVATVAIGKMGSRNAGLLAARIIALSDPALTAKLEQARDKMKQQVEEKDQALQKKLAGRAR